MHVCTVLTDNLENLKVFHSPLTCKETPRSIGNKINILDTGYQPSRDIEHISLNVCDSGNLEETLILSAIIKDLNLSSLSKVSRNDTNALVSIC